MKNKIILLCIFVLAIVFRFNNLNWDNNHHLHPDERFLTMVGNASKIPSNLFNYLDQSVSTLNPANVGYSFFVYGRFPLIMNKLLAGVTKLDTYNDFTLQGRFLSALADLLIVFLVFKTAKLLDDEKKNSRVPYWAAFFYAIAVMPIQLSHFFAVDTFLNLFCFASFYFALKFSYRKSSTSAFLSALFFGLALASKVTAIFILPLNLFVIFTSIKLKKGTDTSNFMKKLPRGVYPEISHSVRNDGRGARNDVLITLLFYALISYFALRLADPYYFQSSNIFNIALSQNFLKNIADLKALDNPAGWFPPSVQWIHKTPVLYSLKNLMFFGLGLPYFILVVIGIGSVVPNLVQRLLRRATPRNDDKNVTRYMLYAIFLWVLVVFLYQSTRHSQSMRYFILLYPFFAIFAAYGVSVILNSFQDLTRLLRFTRNDGRNVLRYMLEVLLIVAVLVWPVAFSSIYLRDHSRVEASKWIYQNIPSGKLILSEHWDDALPLNVQSSIYGRPGWIPKEYMIQELPVFNEETPEKWQQMNELLNKGDYYILSSNRGWGSMPTAPERYPRMTEFYKELFAGRLAYKKIKEFNSFPELRIMNYVLRFPDGWADESFTVYDHPQVMIFKKN